MSVRIKGVAGFPQFLEPLDEGCIVRMKFRKFHKGTASDLLDELCWDWGEG